MAAEKISSEWDFSKCRHVPISRWPTPPPFFLACCSEWNVIKVGDDFTFDYCRCSAWASGISNWLNWRLCWKLNMEHTIRSHLYGGKLQSKSHVTGVGSGSVPEGVNCQRSFTRTCVPPLCPETFQAVIFPQSPAFLPHTLREDSSRHGSSIWL